MARGRRGKKEEGGGEAEAPAAAAASNSKDRQRIIKEVCRQLAEIDGQKKQLNEDRAEIVNTRIKGHLGMKAADFAAAFRLYKLEGDDRAKFFDTLRETFDALGVGEQMDWLDGEEGGEAPDTGPEAVAAAREAGKVAGAAGKNLSTCPHQGFREKKLKTAWETGWSESQETLARGLGDKPAGAAVY